MKKILSVLLCFCMILSAIVTASAASMEKPQTASKYSNSGYTTYTLDDCKLEWTVPNTTEGGTTCTALQGMNTGTNYCYVAKKNSADTYCDITRIDMNTGAKTVMNYYASTSATTSSACDTLGHANEISVVGIGSEHFMYVATLKTPQAITRLKIVDDKLMFTGYFDLVNTGGDSIDASAIRHIMTADGYQYFLIKRAKKFYACKIPTDATGGPADNPTKITINKIFTLNTSNAVFATSATASGTIADMDSWTNQGFGYNKSEKVLYVPIWDSVTPTRGAILTYNLSADIDTWIKSTKNSTRIVYPTKTNFLLQDKTLEQFEPESCSFRTSQGTDGDLKLYIGVNCYPSDKEGVYSCTYTSGTGDFTPITDGTTVYTVKYDANGGTGTTAETNHVYGIKTKLRTNAFTRTGYSFAGWYLTRESDGKWLYFTADGAAKWYAKGSQPMGASLALYGDRRNISALSSANNDTVTCYAQWTPDSSGTQSFYVQYDANGGTGTMEDTKVVYGTGANLRANTFTREGYVFTGWTAYRRSDKSWAYKSVDGLTDKWIPAGDSVDGYIRKTYNDSAFISKTSSTDADIVTLYATWSRVKDLTIPASFVQGAAVSLGGAVETTSELYGVTVCVKDKSESVVAKHEASLCGARYNLSAAAAEVDLSKLVAGNYTFEVVIKLIDGATPTEYLLQSHAFIITPAKLILTEAAKNEGCIINEYLRGVDLGTKASVLTECFDNTDIRITDGAGNTVTNDDAIGTGYTVTAYSDGAAVDSVKVVVMGDTNGDAVLSASDYMALKLHISGTAGLSGEKAAAGDVNNSGSIDGTDYISIVTRITGAKEKW